MYIVKLLLTLPSFTVNHHFVHSNCLQIEKNYSCDVAYNDDDMII